ncbi:hypothetical protein B2J88_51920 [Rhodococcus sp. SRB_17]|nr:hypothetical protein [Rhodococcus sp. SRB_17]
MEGNHTPDGENNNGTYRHEPDTKLPHTQQYADVNSGPLTWCQQPTPGIGRGQRDRAIGAAAERRHATGPARAVIEAARAAYTASA